MHRLGLMVLLSLVTAGLATSAAAPKSKPEAGAVLLLVYVDKNENGERNNSEPLMRWPVALSRVEEDAIVWTEYGETSPWPAAWTVEPGTYYAEAAVPPANSNWYPTGPASVEVTVAAGQPAAIVAFGFNRRHTKLR